ncbi:hypothetical protein CDAR_614431 [Caerostris darwini]|uniref:Uncharacterized protein n=1 Tax=Caerostris darwini TaxID=1538125 RepID=A0AAV4NR48_9ARAC|nr:hypothetical protein CDAR_614431 [Caerostris darwini]
MARHPTYRLVITRNSAVFCFDVPYDRSPDRHTREENSASSSFIVVSCSLVLCKWSKLTVALGQSHFLSVKPFSKGSYCHQVNLRAEKVGCI